MKVKPDRGLEDWNTWHEIPICLNVSRVHTWSIRTLRVLLVLIMHMVHRSAQPHLFFHWKAPGAMHSSSQIDLLNKVPRKVFVLFLFYTNSASMLLLREMVL